MHSMLCGHVSVCVCVRKSLPHVFPASGFEPRPMIGLLSMWCHGLLSTRMRKPLRSSLKNSHLRVQLFGLFDFFFSPSVPARFLFVCVFRPVHFGFWTSSDSRESLSPLVFRRKCVFKTLGMFFYAKATSIVLSCSSLTQIPYFVVRNWDLSKFFPSFLSSSLEPPPPPTLDSAAFVFFAAPHCPIFGRTLREKRKKTSRWRKHEELSLKETSEDFWLVGSTVIVSSTLTPDSWTGWTNILYIDI